MPRDRPCHSDGTPIIRNHDDAIDCLVKVDSFSLEDAVAVYLFELNFKDTVNRREEIEGKSLSAQDKESILYNTYNAKAIYQFRALASPIVDRYRKEISDGKWYTWTSKGAFQGFLGNVLTLVVIIAIGVLGKLVVEPSGADSVIQKTASYISSCILFREQEAMIGHSTANDVGLR